MRIRTSLCVLYCIGFLTLASCQPSKTKNVSVADPEMKVQADLFLQNMAADLQHRQAVAIRQAIDGNNIPLNAVRNARNTPPQLSDNVQARMLTPSLRLYEPKAEKKKTTPVLLYFHGGGWTFGSLNSCGRFCNAMAASGQMKVIALDYRLAPEHPFPAGLDDCAEAVRYVREHAEALGIDPKQICLGGDSSGGNLAIACAMHPSCEGVIHSLLLFYPVTKAYNDQSHSWNAYGKGYGLDAEIMEEFNRAYVGDDDVRNTRISVGLCTNEELQRLPRTLLIAAGRDILRDQGCEFAERLGRKATRVEYADAVHLFITVPGQDKAFDEAVKASVEFIQ